MSFRVTEAPETELSYCLVMLATMLAELEREILLSDGARVMVSLSQITVAAAADWVKTSTP